MPHHAAIQPKLPYWGAGSRQALVLDGLERAFVLLLATSFIYRLVPHVGDSATNLLIMISEGLTAAMMLVRRPGPAMNTGYGWAIAIIGTCAPLMVVPGGAEWLPFWAVLALMTAGLSFSISAKLFLRRAFGIVPANRGVERGGPYRVVRHPIYFGYLLAQGGYLLANLSAINVAVYAACWTAMVLRIEAEERMLLSSDDYALYRNQVRFRLLPGLW